jgi:signal transduction histidine kinase/AmiR/NasT family two-component response regulator
LETWFDERFLEAGEREHRQWRVRVAVTLAAALLLAIAADWRAALAWAVGALLVEAWLQSLTRAIAEGEPLTMMRAVATVIARMLLTYVWIAVGVVFWAYGGAAGQTCAMGFFAALLFYVVASRERSPLNFVPALPTLVAPFVTALLFPAPFPGQAAVLLLAAVMGGAAGFCLLRDRAATPVATLPRVARPASESRAASPPVGDEELSIEALRQAKADAEAASQAKTAFLATMSHEIRTPLNGVLGMTQALAADPTLTQGQRARLRTIRQSGEALLAILNDMLDLSKIEAGKLELETIEFDLEEIARDAHATFKALVTQKDLEFRLSVEPAATGLCLGDPTRVRQVLFNVISNALKFTDAGEIRVQIERSGAKDVRITIADTGVGIEAAHLERIFGKFEQADVSSTRRYGGTGLGLAICRDLCGLMGGSITAQSEPGRGTRILITLPLPKPAGRPRAVPQEPTANADEDMDVGGLRVLAAEDNTVNQLVLKTLLAQIGIEPTIVENGALAVEAWATCDFDLILMDIQMPQMDGMEATRAIRAEEAKTGRRRIPIIALTANAMAHQVAEYAGAGIDAHIPKPLDVRALKATIKTLMARPPETADQNSNGAPALRRVGLRAG